MRCLSGFPFLPILRHTATAIVGSHTKNNFIEDDPKMKFRQDRIRKIANRSGTSNPKRISFLSRHLLTGVARILKLLTELTLG
jgi:hypothetical protein